MNQGKNLFRKLGTFVLASFTAVSLSAVSFSVEKNRVVHADDSSTPRVQHHTQAEIIDFVKSHPVSYDITYDVSPDPENPPYSAGKLSSATQQNALNLLNTYRFIAGLSSDVSLDQEDMQEVQSGALVNAVNGGLSHSPSRPDGMSDELYQAGYDGASDSNLAMGGDSPAKAMKLWMTDGGVMGHRRWCLNPSMNKTVFGQVGSYSAMYAFGASSDDVQQDSMWPAENTPVQYITDYLTWSFSTGAEENKADIQVNLKNEKTGEEWKFSDHSNADKFNVDNEGYGMPGCILFRPDNVTYDNGDKFSVTISGTTRGTISYTVNIFDLDGDTAKMYRAYNPNSGEHFYTSSRKEFKHIVSLGWIDEGIGWIAPKSSGNPVYRLYNRNGGEHHYTLSEKEKNHLISLGWKDEGVGWYSDDQKRTPLYRQYNPNAFANNHNYTTSDKEKNYLVSVGWRDEGIGWYGIRPY